MCVDNANFGDPEDERVNVCATKVRYPLRTGRADTEQGRPRPFPLALWKPQQQAAARPSKKGESARRLRAKDSKSYGSGWGPRGMARRSAQPLCPYLGLHDRASHLDLDEPRRDR